MSETYCGKDCAACTYKEQLSCPGCAAGPGKHFGGDCELARCCQSKGHRSCETCQNLFHCGIARGKDRMAENRIKKREAEEARLAALIRRAPVLSKWLQLLFWLIIPSTVADILTQNFLTEAIPALALPGHILSGVCILAYGAILLRLHKEEEKYGFAGGCTMLAGVLNLLSATVLGGSEGWVLVLSIVTAIISLVGQYQEFMGHSAVLVEADAELSEKWEKLWKWNIGTTVAILAATILVGIAPLLMLLVILAGCIAAIVVSILKLVYLYRTAQVFKEYLE